MVAGVRLWAAHKEVGSSSRRCSGHAWPDARWRKAVRGWVARQYAGKGMHAIRGGDGLKRGGECIRLCRLRVLVNLLELWSGGGRLPEKKWEEAETVRG